MDNTRRGFLLGASALLITAPAIVRASSLMAIRPLPKDWAMLPEFSLKEVRYVTVHWKVIPSREFLVGTPTVGEFTIDTKKGYTIVPPDDRIREG